MEALEYSDPTFHNRQVVKRRLIFGLTILYVTSFGVYLIVKTWNLASVWDVKDYLTVSTLGLFIYIILTCFFYMEPHDKNSFLVKPGFEPVHVLFTDRSDEFNVAINANAAEICVSQRRESGAYEVTYYRRDEIVSEIVLNKVIKQINVGNDAHGAQFAGYVLGGPIGLAIASGINGKKKQETRLDKVTWRLCSKADPKTKYEFDVSVSVFGFTPEELHKKKDCEQALRLHSMIRCVSPQACIMELVDQFHGPKRSEPVRDEGREDRDAENGSGAITQDNATGNPD